jgi:type III secretory pathway component EscT
MTFFDLVFTLLRRIAEKLDQVLAEAFVKHLSAALRDKHNVTLAK